MRKKLHCSARVSGIKMHISSETDCAEFAKKAEFANILFNIMNGKRAKRGYKCRKGIAAFQEGNKQRRRHGDVKRDGKKNGKRC